MKFEIVFELMGSGDKVLVPDASNPVEADSLADCLVKLGKNLPIFGFGVKITGVIINKC